MASTFAVIYKYDIFGKVSVNHMVVVVVRRQGLTNNTMSDLIMITISGTSLLLSF
jgi:hypothetical protein